MSLKALVETTIKLVVQEPDVVQVSESKDKYGLVFNVQVAPNDVGRLIGKDGRVIGCIRQIVGAAGQKARLRASVKVVTE